MLYHACWLLLLSALASTQPNTFIQPYVVLFSCNDILGTYYIGSRSWTARPYARADLTCQSTGASLPTSGDTGTTCMQSYVSHISTYLGLSASIWVLNGTCYAATAPQCHTAPQVVTPICKASVGMPTSALPECPVPTIANGIALTPSGRRWPSEVIYTCNSGYYLTGQNNVRGCRPTGTWTFAAPTCIAITCPQPTVRNGVVTVQSPSSGTPAYSRFKVQCNEGFELIGPSNLTCPLIIGDESFLPVCKAIKCPAAPGIANGCIEDRDFVAGDRASVVCDTGFRLRVTRGNITCSSTGVWTDTTLQCEQITCLTTLTSPLDGSISTYNNVPYSIVTFSCNTGFALSGEHAAVCLANGTWSSSPPQCKKTICPTTLTSPLDGSISMYNNVPYSIVTFSCNTGFALSGEHAAVCLANGTWSSSPPQCKKTICPTTLTSPLDGSISTYNNVPYSIVTFSCSTGFTLSGEHAAVCLANGTWSSPPPQCKSTLSSHSREEQSTKFIYGGAGLVLGFVPLIIVLVVFCVRAKLRDRPLSDPAQTSVPVIPGKDKAVTSRYQQDFQLKSSDLTESVAYGVAQPEPEETYAELQ